MSDMLNDALNAWKPRAYNNMTERERTIARASFDAGRINTAPMAYPDSDARELEIAVAAFNAGKAYEAGLQ